MATYSGATPRERMMAARIRLIRDHVFFGSMAMRLALTELENFPAMAGVNGRHLFFNPTMIDKVSPQALTGLVAHETLHVMLLHHLRRGDRHHLRWNMACDYAINLILKEQKFQLPEGGLCDAKYANMTAEEIYDRLPEDMGKTGAAKFSFDPETGKSEGGAPQPTPGGFDVVMDVVMDAPGGMTEQQVRQEEAAIKAAVNNAAAMARKAGKMSAGLEKMVEALCAPKANWQSELWEFLTAKAETDYSWAQPDKRMMRQYGVIYPTLDGYKLGNIAIINDTSGSTAKFQEQFASELSDILSQFECTITIFNHDTKTTAIETYSSDDMPLVLKTKGYGGTCAKHTFDLIREEYDFDVVVWLTDLELNLKVIEPPNCPVLIACCERSMLERGPEWARVIDLT